MKRMKFFAALLLISTSFFVTSCDNEPIDPVLLDLINNPIVENPINNGVFTASVDDGTNFSALQVIGTYDDSSFGPELNIVGLMANGKKINFQMINPTIETRAANNNSSTLLLFQYNSSSNDSYSSLNNTTNTSTGTITITDFNLVTNKISGTFSFTGYGLLDSSVQKQVTNGVFSNISFTNTVSVAPVMDTFFAKLDGVDFVENQIDVSYPLDSNNEVIGIDIVGSMSNGDSVGIIIPYSQQVGTFNFTDATYFAGGTYVNGLFYTATSGTITVISRTATRIKGTYSYSAYNSVEDITKQVTLGTFDVEY